MHANICKTFTSPTRIMIMDELQNGERTVSELEKALDVRQATLSQHLAVLREKGIVIANRRGHNVHYRISNPKILEACRLMREVLLEQIEQNSRLLRSKEG
ncbi:MAG: metalloregulator ArsR/SmtB family transcription factor [Actinomycetota bacterium]|nr:metalloregulator ArsR/SmtB family transcription factor [Actinomycetota bacterium]